MIWLYRLIALFTYLFTRGERFVRKQLKREHRAVTVRIPFKLLRDGTVYYRPRPGEPWRRVDDPKQIELVYRYYQLKVAEMVARRGS